MSKILFLTTAHRYDDDRIFYHQARELIRQGHQVRVCSLSSEFIGEMDGIEIESYAVLHKDTKSKTAVFQEVCKRFQPDCILCSEPLAVIGAKKYAAKAGKSIIYDITEWYPSGRMLKAYSPLAKAVHAVRFLLIQLYAGAVSDRFIFGEASKKFPLAFFFPFKKRLVLPYYPSEQYISPQINTLSPNKITLAFTGLFSKEKGIGNFFKAADLLRKRRPGVKISLLIIGSTGGGEDTQYFSDLLEEYKWEDITIKQPVSLASFTESYREADICFDLRKISLENHHCLPIKIFYYAASGKPVIYTDLKATRQAVNVTDFGYLVDPEDFEAVAKNIENYIERPDLYALHAQNARMAYEKQYNWDLIGRSFTEFVTESIK